MPKCYQLIGVPAAGKSTWIKSQDWAKDIPVVSTDNFVEAYAQEQGKTYNEVFKDYMPTAVRLMAEQAKECEANGVDVIWDQTSTTVNSRRKKFNTLPDYEHIAVVFRTPDPLELAIRLKNRVGKNIPADVMRSMINGWDEPTEDEGFVEIWYAN